MTEAEQVLYNKLVEEAQSNICGYIEFDGMNCHNVDPDWNDGVPCAGWDGYDHRCHCSNRRVYWAFSDDKTYVYAEAY